MRALALAGWPAKDSAHRKSKTCKQRMRHNERFQGRLTREESRRWEWEVGVVEDERGGLSKFLYIHVIYIYIYTHIRMSRGSRKKNKDNEVRSLHRKEELEGERMLSHL